MTEFSRRTLLAGMGAAALPSLARAQDKPAKITVATYGGVFESAMQKTFSKDFTARTGIAAQTQLGNPDQWVSQIEASEAHPPLDVVQADRLSRARSDEDASPGISYAALFALVRGAAPFAGLSKVVFDGVLDMLSGLYPSDEFAELRPRVTWDRTRDWLTPRQGVKRIAIMNGVVRNTVHSKP